MADEESFEELLRLEAEALAHEAAPEDEPPRGAGPPQRRSKRSRSPGGVGDVEELVSAVGEHPPLPKSPRQAERPSVIDGLPGTIADAYFAAAGVIDPYPWQLAAVNDPAVASGERNLIVTAPTSGGKSFVADAVMLRRLAARDGSRALYVVPYRALAREKAEVLQAATQRVTQPAISVSVVLGGSRKSAPARITVCTPEMADAVLSQLIRSGEAADLTCVVVDELHSVADPSRGWASLDVFRHARSHFGRVHLGSTITAYMLVAPAEPGPVHFPFRMLSMLLEVSSPSAREAAVANGVEPALLHLLARAQRRVRTLLRRRCGL
ncbi:hypothetical protein FNF28_02250 [Cafeteria roenbergensis]|uniref:Helicase ATP-binding domain-containing protein n=1 Tax=Cafeteria roenbergensis TaxID=33653 RepID=A0A5A8DV54_CAFRO|nr:hypothetical protein FNF28_02250 [Cafeteria roenbergensis]